MVKCGCDIAQISFLILICGVNAVVYGSAIAYVNCFSILVLICGDVW